MPVFMLYWLDSRPTVTVTVILNNIIVVLECNEQINSELYYDIKLNTII